MVKKILYIAIPILVTAALIAAGFIGYNALKKKYLDEISNLEEANTALQTELDAVGEYVTCYTVRTAVPYGKQIREIDIEETVIPASFASGLVLDKSELVGNYYRINIEPGTSITKEMVMSFDLKDDERVVDVITHMNPTGLKSNDFVDIRIQLPMGEDYVAIPHKRVISIYGGVLQIIMNEADILTYNSLLVDTAVNQGSIIYTTRYIEPGVQKPAQAFYAVPDNILAILKTDPNVLTTIKQDIMEARREALDAVFNIGKTGDETPSSVYALAAGGKQTLIGKVQGADSAYWSAVQIAEEEARLRELEASYGGE